MVQVLEMITASIGGMPTLVGVDGKKLVKVSPALLELMGKPLIPQPEKEESKAEKDVPKAVGKEETKSVVKSRRNRMQP
jgi:hypothetical protein